MCDDRGWCASYCISSGTSVVPTLGFESERATLHTAMATITVSRVICVTTQQQLRKTELQEQWLQKFEEMEGLWQELCARCASLDL